MRVLFPEPDGPQTTTTSPASTVRSTSWRTCRGPNHLLPPLNSMAAATPLLDHHEDVARVHRLPHLHPDLAHRPPPRGVELVLHLHGLEDDQTIPGLDLLPDLDLDVRAPPGHRGLEHLAAVDGGAAAGADDVARLLLHPDAVCLAVHLDHEDAVLLAHVGHQRGAPDQARPDALRRAPRAPLPPPALDSALESAVLSCHIHGDGRAVELRLELHRAPPPSPFEGEGRDEGGGGSGITAVSGSDARPASSGSGPPREAAAPASPPARRRSARRRPGPRCGAGPPPPRDPPTSAAPRT